MTMYNHKTRQTINRQRPNDLSVVIPVHTRHLPKLLVLIDSLNESLQSVKYKWEIVAVVSPLKHTSLKKQKISLSLRKNLHLTYSNAGLSPATARNFGAKRAKGKTLLFVDSDMEFNHKTFYKLKKYIYLLESKNPVASIYPNFLKPKEFESQLQRCEFLEDLRSYESYKDGKYIKTLSGGFCLVRKGVFKKLGGFNEKIGASEDREFAARLINSGYKIIVAKDINVYHSYPSSLKNILRRKRWHAKGNAKLSYIFPEFFDRPLLKWVKTNIKRVWYAAPRLDYSYILYTLFVITYYTVWFYYYKSKNRVLYAKLVNTGATPERALAMREAMALSISPDSKNYVSQKKS